MSELEQHYESLEEPVEPEAPEVEEAPEPEPTPEPQPEPEFIEFGGQKIPAQAFQSTKRFMDWVDQNPAVWDDLVAWEKGEKILVPSEEYEEVPETEDETFDYDDPQYQRLQQEVGGLSQRYAQIEQTLQQQVMQSNWDAMVTGMGAFYKAHPDLGEPELNKLLECIKDHQLVAVYKEKDPHNPADVMRRALETAYRIEFFDRAHQNGQEQVTKDLEARRRAGQTSSRSATTNRTQPVPKDEPGRKEGMLQELKEIWAARQ
jgi:hypothetical protein